MGLQENQSLMSETQSPSLKRSTPVVSNQTQYNMDRYSLLNAEFLLEQLQVRKQEKEQAFSLASTEIKELVNAVIRDVKTQEEELLDQLWRTHRQELSDLQKTHRDIKSKITDMITIRNSIKKQRGISLHKDISAKEPKVNSQLQRQVEEQIEILTAEGSLVLQRTKLALVFSKEMPDFCLGRFETKPLQIAEEMMDVTSPRPRRNTVLSLPESKTEIGRPLLRKARSTEDIFRTSHQTMSLAFEMTNEDLQPDTKDEQNNNNIQTSHSFTISQTGTNLGQIHGPRDMTYLPNGDMVITEFNNRRLQKFSPEGKALLLMKSIETKPCGVTMTKDGYIAVVDKKDSTIKILTQCGDKICQFGTGYFKDLSYLDTDSNDNFVVIDNMGTWQHQVFVYNAMTGVKRQIGYRKDSYVINHPEYVYVDKFDNIAISDSGSHCVWIFSNTSEYVLQFGQQGDKPGDLCYPKGICTDQKGNYLVADCANHRICQFNCKGEFVKTIADTNHGIHYPQVVKLNNSYLTVLQPSALLFIDASTLDL